MDLNTGITVFLNLEVMQSSALQALVVFCAKYLPYFVVVAFLLVCIRPRSSFGGLRLFIAGFTATFIGYVVTFIIRFFYHHPRPFEAIQGMKALVFADGYSFPSNHSVFFFALATVVYSMNKKLGWWFYGMALVIVFARVVAGVHYPLDILGGVVLGIVVGWLANQALKKIFDRRTAI